METAEGRGKALHPLALQGLTLLPQVRKTSTTAEPGFSAAASMANTPVQPPTYLA